MTREEAIKIINCYDIGFYDLSGEKIPANKLAEAFDMAIEALSAETSQNLTKPNNYCEVDLISRAEAIDAIDDAIDADSPQWAILRTKIGFLPSADAVHGEWKYLQGSIGSYMTIHCPFCGNTFNDVAEWKYNYCPSCGTRMKGGAE